MSAFKFIGVDPKKEPFEIVNFCYHVKQTIMTLKELCLWMNEKVFFSCSFHMIPEVTKSAFQPVGITNAQSEQSLVFIHIINYI